MLPVVQPPIQWASQRPPLSLGCDLPRLTYLHSLHIRDLELLYKVTGRLPAEQRLSREIHGYNQIKNLTKS